MTKTFKQLREINLNAMLLKPRADAVRKYIRTNKMKWAAGDINQMNKGADALAKGDIKGFKNVLDKMDTFPRDELIHAAGLWNSKILGESMSYVGKNVSQKFSYDNWLKKVKGIEKGAHGIKGDEHTKLSKQWKDYKGKDKLAASYEQVKEEAFSLAVIKKELQKIYDTAKKDGFLGTTGHDNFKELLKQTDRKKLYRDMHKVGSSFTSGSGVKSKAVGNDLVDLSYKVNEETELTEGYENNMITHLGELGIDVSFRLGKMIVHKSDLQRVKDALEDGIADRGSVIWNHRMPEFKFMGEEVNEVSPPGWEGSVKAMKKHKDIDNPYALAWHMKNKGDKPHYKDQDGPPVKKDKYKEEQMEQVTEETANVEKAIQIAKKMGGNHTGAVKEIEKIQKGLSDHPKVSDALRTANESLEEAKDLKEFIRAKGGAVKYDNDKQGWFDKSGKRIYLGKSDTAKLMSKDIQRKIRTGD